MDLNTKQLRNMFLKMEEQEREVIVTKKAYVDLAGDLIAGVLLSQIAYWHKPSKKSIESGSDASKLKVTKKNDQGDIIEWLAKGREDWWEEIRISPKQFDRASKILEGKGFIDKKTFKFSGNPTVHVRIIWENFLPAYMKITGLFEDEEANEEHETEEKEVESLDTIGYSPKGKNDIPQKGRRKSTKGEKGSLPKGKKEIDQRGKSLTEITPLDYEQENTSPDYQQSEDQYYINSLLEEEEGHLQNDDYKYQFSESELKKAYAFIAPQMKEVLVELDFNDSYRDRIVYVMCQKGMKYFSPSDYRRKRIEIEKNDLKDSKGNTIGDLALYIVNGLKIIREGKNEDFKSYQLEKARKLSQAQKKREDEAKKKTKSVPFYNWLEQAN